MENSFFRSPWYSPNPNPIRHGQFPQEKPKRSPNLNLHGHFPEERPSKPKVVSVPIHFAESVAESKRKASAAVKIQKVFRGFLVRKNFKTVRKIEMEIDEIQKRIERDADLIWREGKERIRINELLMAVLFRLDSVRGVRDYRKMVIRRAISLQEALDSFSAEVADRQILGNQDQEPNSQSKAEEEEAKITYPEKEAVEDHETLENPRSNAEEVVKIASCEEEATADQETLETSEESMEDQEPKPEQQQQAVAEEEEEEEEAMDDDEREAIVKDIGVDEKATPMEEEEEEGWSIVEAPETKAPEPEKVEEGMEEAKEESEGMKEVMERMVAENKQLKELVAVLCERSAHQCCLMGDLAKRMEQLEKSVETMERKRKKKKREAKNGQ